MKDLFENISLRSAVDFIKETFFITDCNFVILVIILASLLPSILVICHLLVIC